MQSKFSSLFIALIYVFLSLGLYVRINAQLANQEEKSSIIPSYPTLENLLNIKTIGEPIISPDGKYVAYKIQQRDFESDSWDTELWIIEPTTGKTVRLTSNRYSGWNYKWSPDSKWIAFIRADTNGNDQLFIISPETKKSTQLSDAMSGVYDFAWDHKNKYLAYTSTSTLSDELKKRKEYGSFSIIGKDEVSMTHLWLLNLDTAIKHPYSGREIINNISVSGISSPFSWSPDDSKIAFSGVETDSKDGEPDIFVFSIPDNKIHRIVSQISRDRDPQWSPDGGKIIFISDMARTGLDRYSYRLAVVSANGSVPQSISESFDENPRIVKWNKDGIYFSGSQKTAVHLFRLNPETNSFARVTQPDDLIANSFSLSADGQLLAFIASPSTSVDIDELYISSIKDFGAKRLTSLSDQLRPYILSQSEKISWTSTDGRLIEGILSKPKDFSANKKYPLLIFIHGGPADISRLLKANWAFYPVDLWVNRGALMLQVDYRGSAGYGRAFRTLGYRNFVQQGDDVLSGIEYLNHKGLVDTTKMGCMGWSHGGYLTALLGLKTNKFKAISVGAGISDWAAHYYHWKKFVLDYLGKSPLDDPDMYKNISPISYVKMAKTPTLIQHGDKDMTIPIQQAYDLYNALIAQNVKTEMIVYNGFGHGINKPITLKAATEQNLYWFNHYIFGDPLPDFTKPVIKK